MTASVTAVDTTERSNLSGLSITGVQFGTAAANRIVVVCGVVNGIPTACTIGGVSATIQSQYNGVDAYYTMAWALVPTGTSGTVSWTATGGSAVVNFFTSSVYGSDGGPAYDSAMGPTDYAGIDTISGGALVAYSINTTTAVTWTNATETADYQSAINSAYVSMAETDNCTTETTLLVGTGVNYIIGAVAFSGISAYLSAATVTNITDTTATPRVTITIS